MASYLQRLAMSKHRTKNNKADIFSALKRECNSMGAWVSLAEK